MRGFITSLSVDRDAMRRFDLVCFDMDGVLTRTRSSWRWIHDCLGVDSEPNYKAFCNGEIDEEEFMRRDIALWTGVRPDITIDEIAVLFRDMPLIGGIQETVACLSDNGIRSVIISGGIDRAAAMIAREFGFDDYVADRILTNPDGTLQGEGETVVDLRDKGIWVRKFAERYGVEQSRIAAIGNSFTDIGMFKASGMSIAFNPTDPYVIEAATYKVESENIADVLDYILADDPEITPRRRSRSLRRPPRNRGRRTSSSLSCRRYV